MGMSEFSNWVRKWWPGLIPLAALWVAAAWTGTVPMEQHLTARAAAALKESVLDKTQIEVAGRDVRLSADAFSEQGRSTAVDQVASVAGVRTVVDQTGCRPCDAGRECAAAGDQDAAARGRAQRGERHRNHRPDGARARRAAPL